MPRTMFGKAYKFVDRNNWLKHLEGQYNGFVLSCRHRDILRCSKTKHFTSCFREKGINGHMPYEICSKPEYAIIGQKDRAGDFIWRAFVETVITTRYGRTTKQLGVYNIYGNPPPGVRDNIHDEFLKKNYLVFFKHTDPYPDRVQW